MTAILKAGASEGRSIEVIEAETYKSAGLI
jgi:hypothetical protein